MIPEVSNEVRNAADAAVRASVQVLEQVACRVRRGAGGHTVLDGDGFVGAAFRHRTSRAGDPHLHTHVVIANMAHAPERRPVDGARCPAVVLVGGAGRLPLRGAPAVGAHPPARRRVGTGPQWHRRHRRDPPAGAREFSTRRREIEAHLDEHGQAQRPGRAGRDLRHPPAEGPRMQTRPGSSRHGGPEPRPSGSTPRRLPRSWTARCLGAADAGQRRGRTPVPVAGRTGGTDRDAARSGSVT